jgi:hypothetical protein
MKKKKKDKAPVESSYDGWPNPGWPKKEPMPISEEDLARIANLPKTALVSFGERKQWIELLVEQTVDRVKREVEFYVPSDAIAFVNSQQVDGNYVLQHNDWLEFRATPTLAPKSRITVIDAKTIEVDGLHHSIDEIACLVVAQLVKAKGNWLSRRDMKKNEPGLQNEDRIDRIIVRIEATYPWVGDLIEHDKEGRRGYRLAPSMFT